MLFAIFGVLLVEIFKVIDQIKKEIQKKLLDAKGELTLMKLLLMHVNCFIFLVSLICQDFFLLLIHVIYTGFKLFEHESDIRLRFGWKRLFVLYCL